MAFRGSAVLLVTVGVSMVLAGCGSGSHPSSAGSPPSAPASPSPSAPTPSAPSPSAPTTSAPAPATLPDGSRRLLPGHRIVAYYGAAGAPALGVLGTRSAEGIWPRLAAQARAYAGHGPTVLPAYELITYVATGSAGSGGDYSQRVPDSTIRQYAAAARRHHALLILDIQPGRGQFLPDAKSLSHWMRQPDIALALDPEWKLYGHQKPDRQIGHTNAAAINAVSAWLDRLTASQRLPQKLLLVHQFTADMVRDKSQVAARSHLATVFNMDGFGGRAAKLSKYRFLAQDKRFPIGMKLFYRSDVHRFTPAETVRLHPSPAVVDYE